MNKQLHNTIVFLLLAIVLPACKKSNDKDYTASVKDKTWWGQITYTGKAAEYYSVQFKADNTLLWSQLSGDYSGHWVLNGNALSMTFTINSVEIKGTLSEDDKLINITDNTSSYEINNGALSAKTDILLDNTNWKGVFTILVQSLQLNFKTSLKVETQYDAAVFGPYPYTRTPSNGAIRFYSAASGGDVFAVITSANEMRGSTGLKNSDFKVTKQ